MDTLIKLLFYIITILLIGVIIKICYGRAKRRRFLHLSLSEIDELSGIDFERYLMYHLKQKGYKVSMTPVTADYGADLILKAPKGVTIVVQAKRWNQHVGITAVQEVIGAVGYYDADYGVVITNNYYTINAKNLANANDIILLDREGLIVRIMDEQHTRLDLLEPSWTEEGTGYCPVCGNVLCVRSGRFGEFIGCSDYPNCRYTKNIHS